MIISELNPSIELKSIENSSKLGSSVSENSDNEIKSNLNDELYGLNDRCKHQKLSNDQRILLKNLICSSKLTLNEIQSKFKVSYSVLNRLKKWSLSQLYKQASRKIIKITNDEKEEIQNAIKKYLQSTRHTTIAKEIIEYLNRSFKSSFPINFVRNLMKFQMKLNYKRVKSRPKGVDMERINSIRNLFAIKFANFISKETLLINTDESSINRDVKSNYSWGFKGFPIEVNIPFLLILQV